MGIIHYLCNHSGNSHKLGICFNIVIDEKNAPIIAIPPGARLKKELQLRQISQKEFAEQIGMRPSHLSELIQGKRTVTLQTAEKIQAAIGIPAKTLIALQGKYDVDNSNIGSQDKEEIEAGKLLLEYDQIICLKTIFKEAGLKKSTNRECILTLQGEYGLPMPAILKEKSQMLYGGYFRKSAKTGLDARMIATWVVLARHSVANQTIPGLFDIYSINNVALELKRVFHENQNTIARTKEILSRYGIRFEIVERLDHASIDGYSFYANGVPAIVVTKRFDRIDNFAFAVLHELYHVYKHLDENGGQRISIVEYDHESEEERKANDFASEKLVPPAIWKSAPAVRLNNPWTIQKLYSSWAEEHNLNKWIVLGQVSHMTGMYRFRADASRRIN